METSEGRGVAFRSQRASSSGPFLPVITVVAVIAGLHFGEDLVIPFALAILFSFLLSTPVTWLEKLKFGRVGSVLIVLLVAFSIAGGIIYVGEQQLSEIVTSLPLYRDNIYRKLETIQNPHGNGIAKAAASMKQLTTALTPANPIGGNETGTAQSKRLRTPSHGTKSQPVEPVPVEIVRQQTSILDSLGLVGSSVARFFGMAGAVIILTLFILIKRGDLRNRLLRLMGQGHLVLVTTALDDASKRVSRYLLTQSLVNSTFGTLLGIGLYWIGVPYAPFWGVLGALLRFIPYVGTLVAGACPVLLALAVFEGWRKPLLTLGLFVAIEATTSGIVEPWIYATRTGISSLAILLSAAFWTLLWGPIGLMLSTPLTVCLAVLGRHIPQLEFLYVLLGDEPVLAPEARYYQRLLAMDEDEAAEIAESYLKEHDLTELYESMLIPALALAKKDRHHERLDENREKFILQSTRDLIEELDERATPLAEKTASTPLASVACMPARDETDELVAVMVAKILMRGGYRAEVIPIGPLQEMISRVAQVEADILFISALPPFAITHARSVCRKARHRRADTKIVVALFHNGGERVKERLGSDCADNVATNLAEVEAQVKVFEMPLEATKRSRD